MDRGSFDRTKHVRFDGSATKHREKRKAAPAILADTEAARTRSPDKRRIRAEHDTLVPATNACREMIGPKLVRFSS